MHPNAALLEKLYTCLKTKNHLGMADCYHEKATFKDIAFNLQGQKQIHAMWHMISETDLEATFTVGPVDEKQGTADLVDVYTFGKKPGKDGRRVRNVIKSTFMFEGNCIISHVDECNPLKWGWQALGPVVGTIAGLVPRARQCQARALLKAFVHRPIVQFPEYADCGI